MTDLENIVQEVPEEYIPIFIEMLELDTMKEVTEYRAKQNSVTQKRIDVLMQLVMLESINDKVNKMKSFPEVENLLKKISKSG